MRRAAGFTMIEMMMVVAVLGILTVVAVVGYTRIVRKARSSEVPEIFAELKLREDAYRAENGAYMPLCDNVTLGGACAEGHYWPTPLPGHGDQMTVTTPPASWQALRVNFHRGGLYCQYAVIAGAAGSATNIGTTGQILFGTSTPARAWYYLMAQCDWDGDPSNNATYWQRDDLTALGSDNEMR
jgi:prepilin-type N-terminal cleavage/methylation domain-containing protein